MKLFKQATLVIGAVVGKAVDKALKRPYGWLLVLDHPITRSSDHPIRKTASKFKYLWLVFFLIVLGTLVRTSHADGPQSPLLIEPPKSPQPPSPTSTSFPGVDPDGKNGLPRSQRVVNYNIDARWNPANKTIAGQETLIYRNLTGQSQDTFPFHLYLNAFQPKSTWMREERRDRTGGWEEYLAPRYFGSNNVVAIEVSGMGDVTDSMKFIVPDDGNPDDRTVFQVKLPKAVPAGAEVTFKIRFEAKMPEVIARTGYKNSFVLGGQWFPKVGVWWHNAWNCHQFHATTEFFADFGVFDVKLTVPKEYTVGASGEEVATRTNADGTLTHEYRVEDVHDFAWTADTRFVQVNDSWKAPSGHQVKIKLLLQPQHADQAQRHLDITRQSLDHFDRWFGPYPYNTLTVVDPADAAAGGMEYPTFITGDTFAYSPRQFLFLPEVVVEHEFGHQYWYGMVATNEFEDAWLDEGINSYSEKVLDDIYGKDTSIVNNFMGASVGEFGYQRMQYLSTPNADPLVRRGWEFMTGNSYGGITYGKTATVLKTLESLIGEQKLQEALHVYFMRYRFTHPTREDFLRTVEEVSGKNLRWYFDQAVYGTQSLDYEVARLSSEPLNSDTGQPGMYRDQVTILRKGDFIFPVTVEIKFSNGEKLRELWDGRDRWVRFVYDKSATVESAEIDPDHQLFLDANFFNNSKTVTPNATAAKKISNYWLFVSQWIGQILASFV
ncbi:MAG TPA: M1 family metallopeptidase [Candidatus Solibacter sp.]|nr:M1 family metallopeptidase [Candidatus Solibacter sp.]